MHMYEYMYNRDRGKVSMTMASTTTNIHEPVKLKKGKWKKVKLKEILRNPKFLGKTVRLGDNTFEVKGVMDDKE